MRLALLAAVLWVSAPPGAAEAPARRTLGAERAILDSGLWNERINALYDLGELGPAGLPSIEYSDDDADWQVRLTAVHFMGKAGPAAAPELGAIAAREPCPHVRLLALLWLARMGEAGAPYYRAAATPEDEDALTHLPDGYAPPPMGKPVVIDAPDGMNAEFFNGGPDFRVCASSERSGRTRRRVPVAEDESGAREVVKTPDVPSWARGGKLASRASPTPPEVATARSTPAAPETPEQRRRDAELDEVLAPGRAETMPPGPPASDPRGTAAAVPRFEDPGTRLLRGAAVAPVVAARPGESFPSGPPAPAEREHARGSADIVADAGTGKPAIDPVPVLIAQLSSPDARRRARAADELGKRGDAAAAAVPALRRALRDRDRRVRASAVLALGGVGGAVKGVEGDLRRALRDKEEDVRFSAGIALERRRAAAR